MRLTPEEQEALSRAFHEAANELGERYEGGDGDGFERIVEHLIATGRAEQVTYPAGTSVLVQGRDGPPVRLDSDHPLLPLDGLRLVRLVAAEG